MTAPSPIGQPSELVPGGGAPSHVDLVALARALRRSAVTNDVTRVHGELSRLRNALVHHLHAERTQLGHVREATERVVHDGQRRLLALLDDLLFRTEDDDGSCACIVRTAEVELMLRRQAKLEATVRRGPPA